MSEWVKIGAIEVADGAVIAAIAGGLDLALCRVDGVLHAIADRCSHAEARLSEGRLRRGCLVCPRHGTGFDVRDGTHQGPPAIVGVASYEVVEDESGVRVNITPR
ncbi:MAG: Rieske 2Fe-2S domain-containing protein [Acidimicrobiales bacterium]|jgi:nitrite reductase/ring-hydroxylating ferredoxin subunit|nr:Rieske 2Fe-2S domain-containing protein [Acidimicrobiales bacterium]